VPDHYDTMTSPLLYLQSNFEVVSIIACGSVVVRVKASPNVKLGEGGAPDADERLKKRLGMTLYHVLKHFGGTDCKWARRNGER
jgi:hypothetical protein